MDKTENIGLFCDKCRHTPCICGLEKTIKDMDEKLLEKQMASFGDLKALILSQDAKSEYKQAAIIMLRLAFTDLSEL